ncbi:MAG: hypothetical protein LIO79_10050 [Rikenellaceae bacterium]|nr:hypothetical protein [Rikenellaceae bacterium]
MKTKILMTIAALLAVVTVSAQGPQRGQMTAEQQEERRKERIEAMDKAVNLTDEEKAKVNEIFKNTDEKTRELFQSEDREANRAKMQELRDEQAKQLTEVLGEERYKKYEESFPQQGPGGQRDGERGERGERPRQRE